MEGVPDKREVLERHPNYRLAKLPKRNDQQPCTRCCRFGSAVKYPAVRADHASATLT